MFAFEDNVILGFGNPRPDRYFPGLVGGIGLVIKPVQFIDAAFGLSLAIMISQGSAKIIVTFQCSVTPHYNP